MLPVSSLLVSAVSVPEVPSAVVPEDESSPDEREAVFQVDTEQSRFRNAEITGDAGRYIDLFGTFISALQKRHSQYGGTLCNIGKSNHRP